MLEGRSWVEQLKAKFPDRHPGREAAILKAVEDGDYVLEWYPIFIDAPTVSATFFVTNALQIGRPGNSVRVSCTAKTQQQVADLLNAVLPTVQLADETYRQSTVKLAPISTTINSTTDGMIRQNDRIEKAVAGRKGLTSNEGKLWINHSRLKTKPKAADGGPSAVNYGWYITKKLSYGHNYQTSLPNVFTIQSPATAHSYDHVDYSQLCFLVHRSVVLNPESESGKLADIYEIVRDPQLKQLLDKKDPDLNFIRHPKVDWYKPELATWKPVEPGLGPVNASPYSPPLPVPPEPPEPIPPPPEPQEASAASLSSKAVAMAVGGVVGWLGIRALEDAFKR